MGKKSLGWTVGDQWVSFSSLLYAGHGGVCWNLPRQLKTSRGRTAQSVC